MISRCDHWTGAGALLAATRNPFRGSDQPRERAAVFRSRGLTCRQQRLTRHLDGILKRPPLSVESVDQHRERGTHQILRA